jgi:hypothetical protein
LEAGRPNVLPAYLSIMTVLLMQFNSSIAGDTDRSAEAVPSAIVANE